jgi:digeranylgeranylglycerophospholipid reductase
MSYDVVIVGAGPVGCTAARLCAEYGLSTLCIEEHGTIGYPVQCAGLLSNIAFAECEVSGRSVLHTVSGARIITGSASELLINAGIPKASVVDRGALDREMAETAAEAGSEFRLKTAVYDVQGTTVLTRGIHGHEEIPFKILIAADGPRSTIARIYGMQRSKVYLSGIQADIPCDCDPRFVELYPDVSPEFFGWKIPIADGRARIGLCGQTRVRERFLSFVKKTGGSSSVHLVTGTLPLGVMPRTYKNRTIFVGDAAGFAKPTSGGGVYTGIRTARHAAAVTVSCYEEGVFDDAALAEYERRWQADIGTELALGFRLFLLRQQMAAKDIDGLIRALNDPEIRSLIVEHGDMDRPGTLVRMLLKKPALLKWTAPLAGAAVRSLF